MRATSARASAIRRSASSSASASTDDSSTRDWRSCRALSNIRSDVRRASSIVRSEVRLASASRRSDSARAPSTNDRRSRSTFSASAIWVGSSLRSSCRAVSRSARGTTTVPDKGLVFACSTMAMIASSLPWASVMREPYGGRALGSALLVAQTFLQTSPDAARDQAGDVAAPVRDLLDQARGEERIRRVGAHEDRLDAGERMVHLGHLQLVVEVADRAQTLDDDRDVVSPAEVDEQSV